MRRESFPSCAIHGGDQLLFVLVEHRPPLVLGLEIDEIFGVEEAGGVGPSSGRPTWLTTCVTSGNEAKMTRAWLMTRLPSVGPVLGASVPRAQMAPSSRCGRNSEPISRCAISRPSQRHGSQRRGHVTQRNRMARRSRRR